MPRYLCYRYPRISIGRLRFNHSQYVTDDPLEVQLIEGSDSYRAGLIVRDQSYEATPTDPPPEQGPPPEEMPPVANLEDMSKGELKALADLTGVEYTTRTSKAELIAALEA